ncbi:response regulator transcription factor [Pseudoalteromonas denitrificans]|uniref:DNA-binding response regulator, OmpR family, contains REC and winged-helix (WHTH) domain n=1 Tax=Pseudoalteromonas denitrificans DSM 6059 TaxID=1123010 RepID=A0A1I1GXI3_9GAMM|nr:response regulator [Pseudoalteromonas denitrificans]SFC16517.1 DNA-binding response regulator, OmpR family, contains REC and winged-helix (wHTH) domain [Pseudoalteromonas denitrificans DSM 6059]
MSERKHILVTDDEPLNLELMSEILEDDYHVSCVSSGAECLTFLKENTPDVLLLDVAMPNMDGYQICRAIKSDPSLALPILFVSARGSLEERLSGYEAGGDDYLVKPFDNQELLLKVKSMLKFVRKQHELNIQLNEIAMMAMTNSGEIGHLLNFLRHSFECNDLDALTKAVFSTLKQFSLNGTLQYAHSGNVLATFDTSGIYKPVESELLQMTKQQGRIFNHNNRSIFNFENCSLLIKNMPSKHDEKYGRLLDHLCMLMEGVNSRVTSILRQQIVQKNSDNNKALMINTKKGITKIQSDLQKQKKTAIRISQALLNQLETDLLGLGLDDDQEIHITTLVDDNVTKLMNVYDDHHAIEDFCKEVVSALDKNNEP